MIYYAVIDTNILVSALLSKHEDAATVQILERVILGEIVPIYSKDILREYQEVLRRKKFHFSEALITTLIGAIQKYGILVQPKSTDEVLSDVKDLPFYEVVVEKHKENAFLITGNMKHFPIKPYIVTANQMLKIIEENE